MQHNQDKIVNKYIKKRYQKLDKKWVVYRKPTKGGKRIR